MKPVPAAPTTLREAAWVFFLSLLSKLPFLAGGYGMDYDNLLLIQAGQQIRAEGEYFASRFPGYPVVEAAYALFPASAPPSAYHLLVAVLGSVAVAAFYGIARRLTTQPVPITLAFALVPSLFTNSVTAMDYVWALAFFLLALLGALSGRPVLSGVLLGLAVGCRLTTLFVGLPLLLLHPGRDKVRFVVPLLLVSAASYLPAAIAYGPGFLTYYPQGQIPLPKVGYMLTVEVWGAVGSLAVAVMAVLALVRRPSLDLPKNLKIAFGLSILICAAIFVKAPLEGEYLLPAVPLFLLLLAPRLGRRSWLTLAAAFALSLFVGIGRDLSWHGNLLDELATRASRDRYIREVLARKFDGPVVTGAHQPLIEILLGHRPATSIQNREPATGPPGFHRAPTRRQFEEWLDQGPVYVLDDISPGVIAEIGFDPAAEGATVVPWRR